MRPIVRTIANLIEDADGAFLAQSLAGALPVDLNGALVVNGEVIFDPAQKLSVASSGNDSGISLNIFGLDPDGKAISEVLTLANIGTVVSANFYSKILPTTATTGATAGTITGGTFRANGAVSSSIIMNYLQRGQINIGLEAILSGTINVTIRSTLQNLFDPNVFSNSAVWNDITDLTTITATADSNIVISIFALQILVNSANADGVIELNALQGG